MIQLTRKKKGKKKRTGGWGEWEDGRKQGS